MKNTLLAILAVCSIVSAARARGENPTAQNKDKKEETKDSKAQVTPAVAQTPAEDPAYKIGPQDVLKIDVWKEDQLTRTVPVRPDGKITLPLLNDVQAAGLTPMELAAVIGEELKKYINNPQVSVSLMEMNSRRVYVTGEVARAGSYALLPHMTVLQALSGSGGFTQFARMKNIYVLRTENGKQIKLPFNYKQAISGKNPEQNIELRPGDVIVVP
jgi:polysaccharide export outer membrane protein